VEPRGFADVFEITEWDAIFEKKAMKLKRRKMEVEARRVETTTFI
jgi:hypothetical protein